MLDFKTELDKFEPVPEIADLQDTVNTTDIQDVNDFLQYFMKMEKNGSPKE